MSITSKALRSFPLFFRQQQNVTSFASLSILPQGSFQHQPNQFFARNFCQKSNSQQFNAGANNFQNMNNGTKSNTNNNNSNTNDSNVNSNNNNNNNNQQQQQQQQQEKKEAKTYTEEDLKAEIAKAQEKDAEQIQILKEQLEKSQEKSQSLYDKLLRAWAEIENTRKTNIKDVENAKLFGTTAFSKDLADAYDNLARGLDSTPLDQLETNPELKSLYEGVSLTRTEFLKCFAKHGLVEFTPQPGDKFDPNFHSALYKYPDPDLEHGSIGTCTKSGFHLKNRVIRPAQVGVINNPEQAQLKQQQQQQEQNESTEAKNDNSQQK